MDTNEKGKGAMRSQEEGRKERGIPSFQCEDLRPMTRWEAFIRCGKSEKEREKKRAGDFEGQELTRAVAEWPVALSPSSVSSFQDAGTTVGTLVGAPVPLSKARA